MRRFKNIILPGEVKRQRLFYLTQAKLGHIAALAAFMSGFVIKSIVNLQINDNPDPYLLTAFVVLSSILVTTSSLAILITLWIHPLLATAEQINNQIIDTLKKADPIKVQSLNLQQFSAAMSLVNKKRERNGQTNNNFFGLKTFKTHKTTIRLVETAWILAGSVSVFLFTMDVIVLCWIKFRVFSYSGVIFVTTFLITIMIGLAIFGIYFRFHVVRKYHKMGRVSSVDHHDSRPSSIQDNYSVSLNLSQLSRYSQNSTTV